MSCPMATRRSPVASRSCVLFRTGSSSGALAATERRARRVISRVSNLAMYDRAPVAATRWLAEAFGFDPPLLPETEEEAALDRVPHR